MPPIHTYHDSLCHVAAALRRFCVCVCVAAAQRRNQKSTAHALRFFLKNIRLLICKLMFKSFEEEEAEGQRSRQRSRGAAAFPSFYLFIYLFIYFSIHLLQLDRGGGRGAATFCGETKAATTPGVSLAH